MLKEAQNLIQIFIFSRSQGRISEIGVCTFSDASFNVVSGRLCPYGHHYGHHDKKYGG